MGTVNVNKVVALKASGLTATQIAARLGVNTATVYRALAKAEAVSAKRTSMKSPQ